MCNRPLRVTNPHYIKLADQLNVEISQFSNQPDYKLQVPCGKCVRCIKKRGLLTVAVGAAVAVFLVQMIGF